VENVAEFTGQLSQQATRRMKKPGIRGRILDSRGDVLAESRARRDIVCEPSAFKKAGSTSNIVAAVDRAITDLATALGFSAVDAGREVRFFNVASLVMHMSKLKAEGKLEPFINDLEKSSLVILDEFGYVPIDVEGARLLYQVISKCHEKRSVIITTNMEFGKWGAVLGDDKMAAALVDRLVYHGRMVEFTGASHRMENALMLGKQSEEDAR
jgi:cell division protein FtsI/penicillin-binding protein 2